MEEQIKAILLHRGEEDVPKIIPIYSCDFRIGRNEDNDLSLSVEKISRYHSFITYDVVKQSFSITDLSTNGTYVQGKRIPYRESFALLHKDYIHFGVFYQFFDASRSDTIDLLEKLTQAEEFSVETDELSLQKSEESMQELPLGAKVSGTSGTTVESLEEQMFSAESLFNKASNPVTTEKPQQEISSPLEVEIEEPEVEIPPPPEVEIPTETEIKESEPEKPKFFDYKLKSFSKDKPKEKPALFDTDKLKAIGDKLGVSKGSQNEVPTRKHNHTQQLETVKRGKSNENIEKYKVLVVDDEELNRDMLARRLQRHNYDVVLAEDGQKTLNLITNSKDFDLILLDIMMPEVSGIEVLKILRKKYSAIQLPIIMVSAKSESSEIAMALQLGANDYITKPIDFEVALARIEIHALQKREFDKIQAKLDGI